MPQKATELPSTARKSLGRIPADELAALDALTSEDIEKGAASDPDNPPMTEEELDRGVFGRFVRKVRERTGLTQMAFAERYGIGYGRLRDWEQGRVRADPVAVAYLKLIAADPEGVAATVGVPA